MLKKPKSLPRTKLQLREAAKRKAVRLQRAIEKKRTHRSNLSLQALSHWLEQGHAARHAYLERIRRALESEGFRSTPLQWRHKGHAYGLVKDRRDKQIHVRVYEDGVVDAEIEIHKRFLEHLVSPRPSAHREIQAIFSRHGIPTKFINEHYLPRVGAHRRTYPRTRTKVAHLLAGAVGSLGLAGSIAVARLLLGRGKGRGR